MQSQPKSETALDLIIDLFAGAGGASEAILRAIGRHPDLAVNHDSEALALHEANHPTTLHLCDDIRRVDIAEVLARFGNRPVGLMWASPDCKDHSKAKGGVPKDKSIRGLAWEVLRWSAAIRRATGRVPSCIFLENVEEFADWGPLHTQGKKAGRVQKRRRRETFLLWVEQLKSLGFVVEYREVVAADFGAPTTRKRLFLAARSDGRPITWPAATHGKKTKTGDLFDDALQAYATAASIIDWSLKVPSIFGRKKDLAPKTQRRIFRGIDRFVISAAKPFTIPVAHSKSGDFAHSIDDPIRTMTTSKGGDFQLVAPSLVPLTHGGGEDRVYDPQDPTRTVTGAHRGEIGLGSAYLVPRYSERDGQEPRTLSVQGPYPTVVPDGNGGSLASVFMQKMSENGVGYRPDGPLHTAMAGAPRHYEVAAFLGRQFGTTASGRPMTEPHPTVMTDGGGGKSQVVTSELQAVHVGRQFGKSVGSDATLPIGSVMPGGSGKTQIVAAHLSSIAYGDDRPRAGLRASSLEGLVGTITASNDKTIVTTSMSQVAPFMAQGNDERVGRPIIDPITTLTQRSTQQQLIAPVLDKYYATGVAQSAARPLDAITAKARFSLGAAFIEQANTGAMIGRTPDQSLTTITASGSQQRLIDVSLIEAACEEMGAPLGSKRRAVLEFLWEHAGQPTAEEWADPLASRLGRLKFGLVVIDEVVWQIVDIGMRMLTPRELYSAQGFGPSYKIEITLANGKPLTKTAQTRMAGNSVSPPPAAAILGANCGWLVEQLKQAA